MNWEIEAEFLDKVSPTVTIAKIVFKYLFEKYEVKNISDIAETTSGGTPLRGHGDYYGGNIPWIKSGELKDGLITEYEETITELGLKNSSAKIYPKGTLVLALYGATAGKVGILNFDSASNQAVAAIYHNDEIEKDYLLWFFKQKRSEYIEISFGAAQPNISQAVVKKTPIPVPKNSIQKDVAFFLNAYEKVKSIDLPKSLAELKNEIVQIHTILNNRKKLIEETTLQQTYLQQLRQSILQEAVQGKFTQQSRLLSGPTDEPASKLLERIKAEKQKLIAAGKLKKEKPLPPITAEEIPFELPKGWVWCRLGELGITQTGATPPTNKKEYFGDFIPFIGPGDMNDGKMNYNNSGLSELGIEKGRLIAKNSILMVCIGGSIGKTLVNDRDITCNQQINTITTLGSLPTNYLFFTLTSPYFQNELLAKSTGSATPIINKGKWEAIAVPLPPLSEQHRIVAKVQQLMQMVNQLEQQVQQSQTQAQQLLQAVLKEAFSSNANAYTENELITMAAEN